MKPAPRSIIEDSLINLLSRPLFSVPNYQRLYSWDSYNVETLWEDISTSASKESIHFMSALLIKQGSSERYVIVDGQQRLITLTLLLKAGLDLMPSEKGRLVPRLANVKQRIEKVLYDYYWDNNPKSGQSGQFSTEKRRDRIQLLNESSGIYARIMDWDKKPNLSDQEIVNNRMLSTYTFFYGKLNEQQNDQESFSNLLDTVLDNLRFIYIPITENEPAQKIYESVNGFTKEMYSGELIKNFALMSLSDEITIQEIYQRYWSYFDLAKWTKNDETKDKLTKILYYWMLSKGTDTSMREPEIYKGYKKYISALVKLDDEEANFKVEKFSQDLHDSINLLQQAENETPNLRVSLFYKRIIVGANAHYAHSIFFSYFHIKSEIEAKYESKLTFAQENDLLLPLESYIIRRFLLRDDKNRLGLTGTKWLLRVLVEVHTKAIAAGSVKNYTQIFRSELAFSFQNATKYYRWVQNKEIYANLAGLFIPNGIVNPIEFSLDRLPFAKMLLLEAEHALRAKSFFRENYDTSGSNIEHWMPRSPKEDEWPLKNSENRKTYTNAIGNLTLLPREVNTKLGNKSLKDKLLLIQQNLIEAYGKPRRLETNLETFNFLYRLAINNEKWDEEEIIVRGQKIAKALFKTFPDLFLNEQTGLPQFKIMT